MCRVIDSDVWLREQIKYRYSSEASKHWLMFRNSLLSRLCEIAQFFADAIEVVLILYFRIFESRLMAEEYRRTTQFNLKSLNNKEHRIYKLMKRLKNWYWCIIWEIITKLSMKCNRQRRGRSSVINLNYIPPSALNKVDWIRLFKQYERQRNG